MDFQLVNNICPVLSMFVMLQKCSMGRCISRSSHEVLNKPGEYSLETHQILGSNVGYRLYPVQLCAFCLDEENVVVAAQSACVRTGRGAYSYVLSAISPPSRLGVHQRRVSYHVRCSVPRSHTPSADGYLTSREGLRWREGLLYEVLSPGLPLRLLRRRPHPLLPQNVVLATLGLAYLAPLAVSKWLGLRGLTLRSHKVPYTSRPQDTLNRKKKRT